MPVFPLTPAVRGILCAIGAAVAFSVNDTAIKFLSGDYPLHQIVFVRALIALALTLLLVVPFDGGLSALRTRRPLAHAARGLCVVLANVTFFAAIAVLPLADATAAFFVAPLFITILSAVVLREAVGWMRWSAVAVGFVGVLIVVRPGGGSYGGLMLLPVLAASFYASLQIMTRWMGLNERASTMAVFIQVMFLIITSLIWLIAGDGRYAGSDNPVFEFLLRAWVWPPLADFWVMVLLGCMSGAGGLLISLAYRGTDAALVAPFEYVALVMAVVWGALIFGVLPVPATWIGIVLIIGSGVFIAVREAQRSREPSAKRLAARR